MHLYYFLLSWNRILATRTNCETQNKKWAGHKKTFAEDVFLFGNGTTTQCKYVCELVS